MRTGKGCAGSKTLTEMPSAVAGKVLMETPSVCGSSSSAGVGVGVLLGCVAPCVKVVPQHHGGTEGGLCVG